MIIRKMTATYGKLENSGLELEPGLNIITAPNESGKSTWCSFIKNMLYGVDSSAREKGGVKPDKTLYAPWDGMPMSGAMDIEQEGEEISLYRKGSANAPLRDCTAVYKGTNQPVPALTGTVGEALLGVPREVFERTAFIGQGAVSVSASPELEKRIAAIVQTGDEGASCTDAEERLRAEMRRRKHNRSGALPEIERQLEVINGKLAEIEREESRCGELRLAIKQAIAKRNELTKQVAESREQQRKKTLGEMGRFRERIHSLETELDELKAETVYCEQELRTGIFGMDDPETVREKTGRDIDAAAELEELAAKSEHVVWKKLAFAAAALSLVCIVFALIAPSAAQAVEFLSVFLSPVGFIPAIVFGLIFNGILIKIQMIKKKENAIQTQISEIYAAYGAADKNGVRAAADRHEQLHARLARLTESVARAQEQLESARAEQKSRDADLLRGLDFSGGESAELTRRYEEADASLRRLREELAVHEGRLSAMGARDKLSEKIGELTAEYNKLSLEYEAYSLAAETLREAGTEIQNRMTPRLSARASEIFEELTGGRYEGIALDRKLAAMARPAGDAIPRESAYLSAGALDQLYLALRLALCEMALPEEGGCPLILDDALGSFDDNRCAAALSFLSKMSKTRQILLFTCHERESKLAEQYQNVNIMSL